ncbi:nuclear transcription factor Y subunit A-2-like isoform X2 [Solanum lycopersicum]|uniref:nuclear transcription factor Y subunit A-2-like isoform X2 n=1 Tax=Solanum lycopersicum TaxID=4081 RepID=UPI0037484D72
MIGIYFRVILSMEQPMSFDSQSYNMDYQGHFDLGLFGQPLGRIMLPLNFTSHDETPIFVNAKQYHGILRRRKFRAKEIEKNLLKPRKPFLHLSRHLHAKRRPRGGGGRFLNTRKTDGSINNDANGTTMTSNKKCHHTRSQNSEVLQCGVFNFNSTKDTTNTISSIDAFLDITNTGHDILMASKWGSVAAVDNCCCNNLRI